MRGSFFLTLRQLLASGFSLISTFVIARQLGPESYGIVSTAIGIFYFLRWTSRFGLGAYLISKPDLTQKDAELILTFYNTCGVLLCILLVPLSTVFGMWTGRAEVTYALQLLTIAIWLDMISTVPISLMTRDLCFGQISMIDAVAQTANYALSVPLVLIYQSYWGPIAGTLLQFFLVAGLACSLRPVNWRFFWAWTHLKPALMYGTSYYFANWLFNLRNLAVPLLLSRLAGVEAVGIANIAIRMVRQLMLLRDVLKRMSMSVMAKLLVDAKATRRALSKGMNYQAILMGTVCASFACFASWLIPTLFGQEWLLSSQIVPLIGISNLVGATFDLHTATLHAAGRNRAVISLNLSYVILLWVSSWILIPPLGIWGYAIAEIIALPAYYLVHLSVSKLFGSPSYTLAVQAILAAVPPSVSSIWLSPPISFLIFLVSYGVLFAISEEARSLLIEIWGILEDRLIKKQIS